MDADIAEAAKAATEGWFTGWLDAVRIDVFVPSIDFSWEAARRRVQRSFAGTMLWFLSAESLCIFKLLFFRTKDLADLEQLVRTTELDRVWVKETISSLMGAAWIELARPLTLTLSRRERERSHQGKAARSSGVNGSTSAG